MAKSVARTRTREQTLAGTCTSEKTLRGWAALLKLPAVCDNAACRRAGACRGAIGKCAPQNFARLPEGVQALACCLWDAREKGFSFDQAMQGFAGSKTEAAWNAWCAEHA
jgi:hypothetical protein